VFVFPGAVKSRLDQLSKHLLASRWLTIALPLGTAARLRRGRNAAARRRCTAEPLTARAFPTGIFRVRAGTGTRRHASNRRPRGHLSVAESAVGTNLAAILAQRHC
jgi:hypothetical protein